MSNNYVYASYQGSQQGVTARDLGLDQLSFINTGFDINGIAAGADNDFYVTAANNIYHYKTDGTLISQMTFPDSGVIYTSLTVRGNLLFAAYKGSQVGVTLRDLNLNQISFFATPFVSSGIATSSSQDVYLTSGNHIYRYKTNGTQLQVMTFPDSSINYTDVSVLEDRVYASYKGSQLGFTVRDLNLNQLSSCNTGFDISSIAAGASHNVYLTSHNHIYNYSTNGNLLADMNFPDTGINYTSASVVFISLT